MEVEEAIRTRRTHKAYRPEPVDREHARGDPRPGALGAQPQPDQPVALPGDRAAGARAAQGGGRARGGLQARSRADPGRLLLRAHRRSDPGRGGPARHRLRRLHRPARRPRPRARQLLAHARGPAHAGGPGGRRDARRRALRRTAPPRASPSRSSVRPSACPPTRSSSSSNDLPRTTRSRRSRSTASTWSSSVAGSPAPGVALDAASRGYSVALLERDDFGQGTSSRSSKMVHGGLRYLQNFDLGLVREALLERQLLVQLAPHLVYPTPFLVPALGEERRDRRIGIGLNMYDVMATSRIGRGRSQRNEHSRGGVLLVAGPPPDDLGRGGRRADSGPGAAGARAPPTSSTTARPTTSDWCSPCSARPSASAPWC